MVPFAGYDMPVHYPMGILREHLHTRSAAGLFDVSHLGQVRIHGQDAAKALETLVPGHIEGLGQDRMRYTLFTNETAGKIGRASCWEHVWKYVSHSVGHVTLKKKTNQS